ncbi:MAG: thioredoxin fold domain-containing protein [Magnetococcales bacterium]|nr:thioredoxin fold domain-containing protein [Magnetococcales bacterium]
MKVKRILLPMLILSLFGLFLPHSASALMNEPFFQDSFLNLQEDGEDAEADGKLLMLFFEQEGCPYCKQLHEETLSDQGVRDYIQNNFFAILIDIYGAREAANFQGRSMREKALARSMGVHFTPTIIYYDGKGKELFRITGFWQPFHLIASMEYVRKGLYKTMNFQDYIHEKARGSTQPVSKGSH